MMRFLMSFMSLPSLASYHIQGLGIGDEDHDFEKHLRPRETNLADLAFTRCSLGERTYLEILRNIKRLRSFACTNVPPGSS